MPSIADRLARMQGGSRRQQRDARVAEAEGLEPGQLVHQLERYLAGSSHGVDPDTRLQILVREDRCGVCCQGIRKVIAAQRVDRETGRRTMAAEPEQVLGTCGQPRM